MPADPNEANEAAPRRVDWTEQTDTELDGHVFADVTQLNAGANADGVYLLGGAGGKYTRSYDGGHTWDALQTIYGAGSVFLWGVGKFGTMEIAVGSGGALLVRDEGGGTPTSCGSNNPKRYPSDGGAATITDLDQWHVPCGVKSVVGSSVLRDVATFGHGNFIVVGDNGHIWVSSNGVQAWTRITHAEDGPDGNSDPDPIGSTDFYGVARVGTANVVVGENGKAYLVQPPGRPAVGTRVHEINLDVGSVTLRDVVADGIAVAWGDQGASQMDYALAARFLVVGDSGTVVGASVDVPALTPAVEIDDDLPGDSGDPDDALGPFTGSESFHGVWSDDRSRILVGGSGVLYTQPKEQDIGQEAFWTAHPPDEDVSYAAVVGDAVNYLLIGGTTSPQQGYVYTGEEAVVDCKATIASWASISDTDALDEVIHLDTDCPAIDSDIWPDLYVKDLRRLVAHVEDTGSETDTDVPVPPPPSYPLEKGGTVGDLVTMDPASGLFPYYRANMVDRSGAVARHLRVSLFPSAILPFGELRNRKDPGTRPIRASGDDGIFALPANPPYWQAHHGTFVDVLTGWRQNRADVGNPTPLWMWVGFPSFEGFIGEDDLCADDTDHHDWPEVYEEGDTDVPQWPDDLWADSVKSFSRFRSSAGHDMTDDHESFRPGYEPRFQSMKHYVEGACLDDDCEYGLREGDTDDAPEGSLCSALCCSDPPGTPDRVRRKVGRPIYAPFDGDLYFGIGGVDGGGGSGFSAHGNVTCLDENEPESVFQALVDDPAWDRPMMLVHPSKNLVIEFAHAKSCLPLPDGPDRFTDPDWDGGYPVEQGQRIGAFSLWGVSDIDVWVNDTNDRWRLISYFDLLPDGLYADYVQRLDFSPRATTDARNPIIPLAERDLCPLEPDYDTNEDDLDDRGSALHCDLHCIDDDTDTDDLTPSEPEVERVHTPLWIDRNGNGPDDVSDCYVEVAP